ncbi:hypothetical protein GYMLUDRAFT_555900 [Collybiopsis luxurians FD-317 M1]|uniref:Uncharacterized protein n=1 Tax=Collybiopsis luxurians FD-317 M1 TaxID=944289 RepID=A0A0D0CI23_9AGAR|nr:hypothetical protein GYMLUDRAFT_555900 [Collybiopsis luxurians FD-317 M1]
MGAEDAKSSKGIRRVELISRNLSWIFLLSLLTCGTEKLSQRRVDWRPRTHQSTFNSLYFETGRRERALTKRLKVRIITKCWDMIPFIFALFQESKDPALDPAP